MRNLYLTGAVILFIILLIPFVQGFALVSVIQFLGDQWKFTAIYPILIMFAIGEGVCITLYFQSIVSDMKNKASNNFDL